MHKGSFSGISILDGEGVTEAGAAFGGQDRSIIDRLLEVGAVTHRHDAHSPLPDPIGPPSAAITTSGGAIPADRTIYVGFTLLDSSGGETLLSDVEVETTAVQYDAPTTAPEASADYSAGSLLIGTYHYAITFTDGIGGETSIGPPVVVTRDPGYASGQVHLWGMADVLAEVDAAGWRLYRATGGGQYDFLAEGTSDTFTDTGAIPLNCAVHPPTFLANSTVGANLLTVVVPSGSAGVSSAASQFRLYLSEDGLFEDPCLYGTYPPSSAGVPIVIPSLLLLRGAPPLVSQALRGANKIDPDTELIDWHWKRPVATVGSLPPAASGSVDGDVRVVKADHLPRVFDGSAWSLWDLSQITAQGSAGVNSIRIQGSGEVGVSAATTSAGETTWTIYAPTDTSGGVGGGTGSGAITIHYSKVAHDGITDMEFAPDGLGAEVTFSGTGSEFATVIHKFRPRQTTTHTVNLASAASENATTLFMAPGYRLIKAEADKACRVRIYSDVAAQSADAARGIGVAATGDHGVIYEHLFPVGDLSRRIVPNIMGSVLDGTPPTGDVPISVTNMGATGDVNVTLTWHQNESFSP